MLGEIICMIAFSSFPVDAALALAHAIDYPVESHVHGFCSFWLDGFLGDSVSCYIIGAHGGWSRLGVTHFCQRGDDRLPSLAVDEEAACFCFCGGGHDVAHD